MTLNFSPDRNRLAKEAAIAPGQRLQHCQVLLHLGQRRVARSHIRGIPGKRERAQRAVGRVQRCIEGLAGQEDGVSMVEPTAVQL